VEITAALAADLAALSEALDEPGADLTRTLRQLAADAKLAVGSFLGLAIRAAASGEPIQLSTLDGASAQVRTSLMIPLPPAVDGAAAIGLILYAGTRGAFTDLAADLAWLSGRDLTDFAVDQHLTAPAEHDGLAALSLINQAIGVLIAHGHTPEQAGRELGDRAARAGVDRHVAATQILAGPDDAGPNAP
jgi:hypothetical protein